MDKANSHDDWSFGRFNKSSIIEIANDLGYPPEVIKKLKKAKTDGELQHIMTQARHNMKD